MKEIKKVDDAVLDCGIKVKRYLSYTDIQTIVEKIYGLNTWAERYSAVDVLILSVATDLSNEEIEATGIDLFVESEIMDMVKASIFNIKQLYEAIDFQYSTNRALTQIAGAVMMKLKDNGEDK